ncbi:hypothetical protein GWK47_003558 [Chionoecetes opilio]|uniref:Uncharacterized protein n=1 Tax=Chionoecetes opilio TaxID=41210 RepID=A0A8J5D1F9_CHIOP|nr:hypothetical protein GWK47_003558 [Chionoecetes opilio]
MRERGFPRGPLETWGSRGQGSGCPSHHGTNPGRRKRGLCSSSNRKRGKTPLHFACRHHILELGGTSGVRPVFLGVFPIGRALSSNAFPQNPMGSIDREDFGKRENMGGSGDVLGTSRMRLFDGLFNPSEREDLRDDYRELGKLFPLFLGGAPPGGIRFLAPEQCTPARWVQKILYSFKIWICSGPGPL